MWGFYFRLGANRGWLIALFEGSNGVRLIVGVGIVLFVNVWCGRAPRVEL